MAGECVVGGVHFRASVPKVCVTGGMHGRGCVWWGACVVGGMCGRGCVAGGMHGRGTCMTGGHAWQERRPVQRTVRILLFPIKPPPHCRHLRLKSRDSSNYSKLENHPISPRLHLKA